MPAKVTEPLRWGFPKVVFVNSMSDLFHEAVPEAYVEQVMRVMEIADWHTYQVLTKRAHRMRDLLRGRFAFAAHLSHVWWGVSVENRKHGLPRIDALRGAPAAMRFLSIEPLLEDLGHINLDGIHWVIVGGESGAGARPMEQTWVVNIREQCREANVPFFFKQWGGVRKADAGRCLEGRNFRRNAGTAVSSGCRPAEKDGADRRRKCPGCRGHCEWRLHRHRTRNRYRAGRRSAATARESITAWINYSTGHG